MLSILCEKCPNTEYFLVRIFPHSDWIRRDTSYLSIFSPNAEKYGPENTTCLDTFHAVVILTTFYHKIVIAILIHTLLMQLFRMMCYKYLWEISCEQIEEYKITCFNFGYSKWLKKKKARPRQCQDNARL